MRDVGRRTLDIEDLRDKVDDAWPGICDPRGVALHLEQRPYVQVFAQSTVEPEGSKEPPPGRLVPLHNGRLFKLQFVPQALIQD